MKRIVVVSDLHVGSIYGLLPPNFETSEGVPKAQNAGQKYLWDCWVDFCKRTQAFKPDCIVVNGDMTDGKQQAQRQIEASLVLMPDQISATVETLKLLKAAAGQACKFFAVAGTVYHVGDGNEWEEAVAGQLGAVRYRGIGTGRFCREVLDLKVEGVVLNFAHHISVTSGFYRATAADREGQWSAITAKDATKSIPKADVIVRSHVHNFIHVEHASKHILQTPCWQLQTRFMRKNSIYRMLPDIGGLFLEIDGAAKECFEDPLHITKHLYVLPPAPVNEL